ncbi:GGDEF domain-containing protein [Pelagibacterium halotolerans]|uniref:Diguanylate cyclase n=1 Tax=Pelagibacterium halotolerans (strain DSM 22347 / JCM 15775 / CGMCC 1.7692 / B2) TaxID=1082931 RepID=G4R6X0_PELHB|nr:GGDEF domain-containing protein [Pelagibacterium halotolerans]AEQ53243.1 diguanylate cyclase [Pelagibacterium halotolerans B2]QJR17131.1 GGDEF domain-containing protein [Pelagibacterium halotolerans]SEA96477.1 GGDEF domain-containing protein, diguanylate cyclase (c-di-GMP synthetase) or its enzymatically inactive variants [Pelagibacterium halotolerans]
MTGALLVFWVIVALCTIKAGAFLALARFDPKNRGAVWFAAAFAAAATSFLGEIVLTTGFYPGPTRMVIALAMVAMFVLVSYGLAIRYRVDLHPGGGWAIVAASALLYWLILDLPREDFVRQFLYQIPYALLSLLSLSVIWRSRAKKRHDWLFIWLFLALALHFLAKPFLALWTGGVGATATGFSSTVYAGLSTASGAVLLLILATGGLALMLSDTAGRLIQKAERDAETGLLNREGFTTHAERRTLALGETEPAEHIDLTLTLIAIKATAQEHPAALPLKAMAKLIADNVSNDALVGRMADRDFAILSPQTNLMAARRAAEALRIAAGERLSMPDRIVTLSIGITEREKGEVYADLLARGLWALDEAERAGGNCVRLAARSSFGVAAIRRG